MSLLRWEPLQVNVDLKLDVLARHCDEVGRDLSTIEVSAHLFEPLDPATAARTARELAAAGCDHVIIYMNAPFAEATLRNVARAVADATA